MSCLIEFLSSSRPSSLARLFLVSLMLGLAVPRLAAAADIKVTNDLDIPYPGYCNLRQAIVAHNERVTPFPSNCTAGTGHDTIIIASPEERLGLVSGSPFPTITNGTLTIRPYSSNRCTEVTRSAYMTLFKGATLTLQGIGIVVNGAEFKSVIDNNGGTLIISPNGSARCLFSNQFGKDRKTDLAGVLNNRDNGTAVVNADFENSAAREKGGAIYVDSGTVTIEGGSFNGNGAHQGGAIFVNNGAKLDITSSDFSINNNKAGSGGAAIYNNGGTVSIKRSSSDLKRVSIAFNQALTGAAIYSQAGKVSVDGIEINNNSSTGSGGAIVVSDLALPNHAKITRTYLHHNSAGVNGGAIYATGGSTLNVAQDTFAHDRPGANGLGGGIYIDGRSELTVVNSTFIGDASPDGIYLRAGSAGVTFSTLVASDLLSLPQIHLSNTILLSVTCSASVVNDSYNLQFQSSGCPTSIPVMNPDLSPGRLAHNGGPTPTIALLSVSPAIDAIPYANCTDQKGSHVTTDQRGFPRPDPEDGPTGPCDIGAYEFQQH